jgi:hypothetical protein
MREDARFGNQFWKLATQRLGRPLTFATANDLWEHCVEYFDWCEEHPLYEDNLVTFQGVTKHEPCAKMRAMTTVGLCLFLGITTETWRQYRNKKEFSDITTRADQVIRTQKFEGAAAELLNSNIIARDLGLAEKSEVSGKIETVQTDAVAIIEAKINALAAAQAGKKDEE